MLLIATGAQLVGVQETTARFDASCQQWQLQFTAGQQFTEELHSIQSNKHRYNSITQTRI